MKKFFAIVLLVALLAGATTVAFAQEGKGETPIMRRGPAKHDFSVISKIARKATATRAEIAQIRALHAIAEPKKLAEMPSAFQLVLRQADWASLSDSFGGDVCLRAYSDPYNGDVLYLHIGKRVFYPENYPGLTQENPEILGKILSCMELSEKNFVPKGKFPVKTGNDLDGWDHGQRVSVRL